ncbi:bacillithiol system redox-active protein YtxJ [Maribacter sp. 2307ULW6-5]|uniref:bacillithiol system redox-active protein YtxJ n=1 Tax=Maribacter sp. 2307ULW6-5 TaxID=3386275 RepID=UPI0039BCED10
MGLFGKIFGNSGSAPQGDGPQVPWQPLVSRTQLEEIPGKSKTRPQLIFKHSTTCGISRMVLNGFNAQFDLDREAADLYYLDLHAHRDLSNAVAEVFQVMHQSPQLLIIKDGAVVAHDSHGAISDIDLKDFV